MAPADLHAQAPLHVMIQNVFHVSVLKKYVLDPNNELDFDFIQMKYTREILTEPLMIVSTKQQHLWNQVINWVKVFSQHYLEEDVTGELESKMRNIYSHLFDYELAPWLYPFLEGEDFNNHRIW